MAYFTTPPPAPDRRDPDTFANRAKDSIDYWGTMTAQAEVFAVDMNTLRVGAETSKLGADTARTQTEAIRSSAVSQTAAIRIAAEQARDSAMASANFKGLWAHLGGAASVPYSVYHNGFYWSLVNSIANVALSEPSETNTDWRLITIGVMSGANMVKWPSVSPLTIPAGQVGVSFGPVVLGNDRSVVIESDAIWRIF